MDRRGFLKILGLLPFGATLCSGGRVGASEGQLADVPHKYIGLKYPIKCEPLTATKVCNQALEQIGEKPIGKIKDLPISFYRISLYDGESFLVREGEIFITNTTDFTITEI